MKGSRTYASGKNSQGQRVVFRTTKKKDNNYIYVEDELFFESSRFESALEVINGMLCNVQGGVK